MPLFAYIRSRSQVNNSAVAATMLCRHLNKCKSPAATASAVLPFKAIPSPRGLPLFGTTLSLIAAGSSPKLHKYVDGRHRELGAIYRENLGPVSAVFVSDPDEMRAVFAQEGKYPKHLLPEAWTKYNEIYGCSRGLFFMDGPKWKHHRTIMNNLLLKGDLNWIETACDFVSDKTINNIESKLSSQGEILELEAVLYKWSLDVIISVLLGSETYKNCCDELDKDVAELASIIHLVFQTSSKLALISANLASKLNIPPWKRFVKSVDDALSTANSFVSKLIRDYHKSREGLLPNLLNQDVKVDDVRNIITDLVLAAGDTTAYAMEWILYLVAKHEDIQQQLRENCEFSKNVIREALRLYPVAPFLTRILPEDSVICGYEIPGGTIIILSIYTSGRDERWFENANVFEPNRWSRGDEGMKATMLKASLPFAMGARSCIGKRIAERQLQMTLVKLVNKFQVGVFNERDVEMILKLVAVPSEPIRLRLTKL